MHIDNTLRLDFKDVLIRPKRSTLISRSEVDITRDFKFLHAPVAYHGIPVIAANMDTTGTFEMAKALDPFMLSAALDKHYSEDELVKFFTELERKATAFYTLGIGDDDWEKFQSVNRKAPGAVQYVCIDVRERLHGTFVTYQEGPRHVSGSRHHGGQRRDGRHDRRAPALRRRYREDRHRTGLRLPHPQDDRCRLPAALRRH